MPYYHYMDHGDGGWSVLGIIWVVLLAILVILAVVALFRWGFGGGFGGVQRNPQSTVEPPTEPGDSAISILDRRLAAGEIDVDDYERRRTVLEGRASAPPGQT